MDKHFFEIKETCEKWIVKQKSGKLETVFEISKDICSTEDEIQVYLQKEGLYDGD